MAALLLILAILGIVVLVDAVIENTATQTLTLFGQELSGGLSIGEWLAVAAGLGLLIMLLLSAAGAASRRRRARRHDLRATKDEMADRVAELERENYSLRESTRPTPPAHARTDDPARDRPDAPAHARTDDPARDQPDAPAHARSDTPSDGTLWDRLTGGRGDRGHDDQKPAADQRHDTATGGRDR